jgi:hypothetical protein
LPTYQRGYQGERYPHPEQQAAMHQQNYHYEHQDPLVRERMYGPQGRGPEGHEHEHDHDHEQH